MSDATTSRTIAIEEWLPDRPGAAVDAEIDMRQSSWTKYSSNCARLRIRDCCRSIENCWTCPSRKLANGVPVALAVVALVGRLVNRFVNVNWPVGDGGWITFSRSQRRSAPSLIACRPFCHVSESAICVTLVPKSEAVDCGEPSCW